MSKLRYFRVCLLAHSFARQSGIWPTNIFLRVLKHSCVSATCFEGVDRYKCEHFESGVFKPKGYSNLIQVRLKSSSGKDDSYLSSFVQPIPIKACRDPDGINVGEELTRTLKKDDLLKLLNAFCRRPEAKKLAAENGLDSCLFHKACIDFRRYCIETDHLPVDLHIIFSDILQEACHIDDLFPYFIQHARTIFPHLDCIEDLKKISDLRRPANWYPEARALERKIIFHAGPTNSGKTYHALERFYGAKSGVYCGPLRLLANEVYSKSKKMGVKCDLVTGEEQHFSNSDGEMSAHLSCTVEMTSVSVPYEVAVIDEIQMIRDVQRGWAWTRAFLGVCAQEVHVCGEASAVSIIKELAMSTGDQVEVRTYKRLTTLSVLNHAVENFDHVKPGDCVVCFSKNDIYTVSRQLEKRCVEVAVIYGTLPPGTKLAQAEKFNNPESSCKVMVATDAIGMGLNLNIKRIIFYSLMKPHINEKGEKEMDLVAPSAALQIAGRAGRYASEFVEGEVTCFKSNDLLILKKLLNTPVELVQQAGLHPTAEQIELFAYHLPKATLSNLIDIFVTLCQLDNDKYFMCNMDDFKFLADMIEHIPLQLRVRYVFCCAPIPKKQAFVCTMFLKFARQFCKGQPLTLEWMCRQLGWPLRIPLTVTELVHLEGVFDVLDLYLWLSYRFMDMFPNANHVRDMQKELDRIIHIGILNITRLLHNNETKISSGISDNEDDFEIQSRTHQARHLATFDAIASSIGEGDMEEASRDSKHSVHFHYGKNTGNGSSVAAEDSDNSDSLDFGSIRLQPGERLADQLLKQGLLTKDMLKKLQQELKEQIIENYDDYNKQN